MLARAMELAQAIAGRRRQEAWRRAAGMAVLQVTLTLTAALTAAACGDLGRSTYSLCVAVLQATAAAAAAGGAVGGGGGGGGRGQRNSVMRAKTPQSGRRKVRGTLLFVTRPIAH
jgi:hypothetical protein